MVAPRILHEETERFLAALAPDGALSFQSFDDSKAKRKDLSRIVQGGFDRHAETLAGLNKRGAGIFVMVNRGDMKGRKTQNVLAVRAIFLDLDGAPLGPVLAAPIRPAIVCESSPGKHHAYWPVSGMPLSEFRAAQKALAARYGGDPVVCDVARVMRLPGFVHAKREAYVSRLLHCDPVMPWRWSELAEALSLPHGIAVAPVRPAGGFAEGERNPALYRFACALRGQGLQAAEALRRVLVANTDRCMPPLGEEEVSAIVSSALQGEVHGFAQMPYAMLDTDSFRRLPDAGKVAILALHRNYNGRNNGRITLTRSDAKRWRLSRYKRTAGLQAAATAELIECTERGTSALPGQRATPDRFRLLCLPG